MSETFLLFARPSFVEGVARVIDLGNTLAVYNESSSGSEADNIAIHSDWSAIGQDIQLSINEYNSIAEDVQEESQQ